MLKSNVRTKYIRGIYYIIGNKGRAIKYKPWLGDLFASLYDFIMEKSIFPRKFNGDIDKHFSILKKQCSDIHDKTIVEIATGSGNIVEFLPSDNYYFGIDISPGLLKTANNKLKKAGFQKFKLFLSSGIL